MRTGNVCIQTLQKRLRTVNEHTNKQHTLHEQSLWSYCKHSFSMCMQTFVFHVHANIDFRVGKWVVAGWLGPIGSYLWVVVDWGPSAHILYSILQSKVAYIMCKRWNKQNDIIWQIHILLTKKDMHIIKHSIIGRNKFTHYSYNTQNTKIITTIITTVIILKILKWLQQL